MDSDTASCDPADLLSRIRNPEALQKYFVNTKAGVVKPLLFMYNVKDLGIFKPCTDIGHADSRVARKVCVGCKRDRAQPDSK